MAQSFSDDFNRTNATTLGANWTDIGTSGFGIDNNKADVTGGLTYLAVWATACDTDDNFSQATLDTIPASTFNGVVCRALNSEATCYNWRQDSSGNSARIQKIVAGAVTSLGSAYSYTESAGDVFKITASGSTITGYINGSSATNVTDTSITSGKYVGMRVSGSASSFMDDWSGGDLTSGATALTVADATHAHTADTVTLTAYAPGAVVLAPATATHAQTAGNVDLTQHNVLTVATATHALSSTTVTLTAYAPGGVTLTIASATHAHTADNVPLVQHNVLTIASATHAHTADNVPLVQHNVLTIATATHAHTADTVVFVFVYGGRAGAYWSARPTATATVPTRATATAVSPY